MHFLNLFTGIICDESGNELPPNSPPPPHSNPHHNPEDWFPYNSCIQFELADFLYQCSQMSQGNTDLLLGLMNALLISHSDTTPFHNHSDMHEKIDVTTVGKAPWEHFTLKYSGPLPKGVSKANIPTWMANENDVWFHNPVTLLENLMQTLTLRTNSTICLTKNAQKMHCIASMILCQAIGPGNKWYVYLSSI